jgi:hypothetical protein
LQAVTVAHVGAAPSELPLDDPASEEVEAPPARPAHAELESRSAHWTKPLQSRLAQLEAPMQVLIADEQLLLGTCCTSS